MAKFSKLARGRAERLRRVSFTALDGTAHELDLQIVTGADDETILQIAAKRAKSMDGEAKRGDPIFDFACDVELVFRSAIDPDSPDDAPDRFFDSADAVREALDRDRIAYLAARQTEHQEKLSPLRRDLTKEQHQLKVYEILAAAEGDDGPFRDFDLSLLRRFTRTLVYQLAWLQTSRSVSGGPSASADSAPTATAKQPSSSSESAPGGE